MAEPFLETHPKDTFDPDPSYKGNSFSFIFYQETAKELRPNTIRAMYGRNSVENAVHVTDLPEDAFFEVSIFLYYIGNGK